MASVGSAGRIAFGQFEVDLQSGELWRGGFRVRLQDQPFKVLTALLARPGQVVTRGELQAHVWEPNTNVDFERSLAVAIKKVREALGDSADNPRFVETLARRGNRFIAPVAGLAPPTPDARHDPEVVVPPSPQVLTHTSTVAAYPSTIMPRQRQSWTRRDAFLGATVLLLLGIVALAWTRRTPPVPPARVVQLTRNSLFSPGPPNMESLLTLVMDGDRVLGTMLVEGRSRLAQFDLSTSEVKPVPTPGELALATLCDISRDGSRLLLRGHAGSESEQALWVVPTAGGSAMRVGGVLAHAATWMPDSSTLLVASGDELATVDPSGGSMRPLLKLPGRAFALRWSPDGGLLRFTLMDPSTHQSSIWELRSGTHRAAPLFPGRGSRFECCGTWTSDGKSYVFQVSDNFSSDLWEFDGDDPAQAPFQLTNGPLHASAPVAARAGRQIFFYGADAPFGLQQFAGPGAGFRPAFSFLAEANRVAFSRDGQWAAWTDPVGKLWRARAADGAERIQLTPDSLDVFLAQWSPDGGKLAMMARTPGAAWQIYLVDKGGGSPERLFGDARNAADPSWSADGRKLVYGREPDTMGKDSGAHTLAVFDLASRASETLPGSQGLFSPRWSPDGKWIAALTIDQKRVMLFDVANRTWAELAQTSAADPVWSGDSRALFVHAFMDDRQPILRLAVPGGQRETVASVADFHAGEPANYFFGGLTPASAPLVQPRVGTGNLYRLDLKP